MGIKKMAKFIIPEKNHWQIYNAYKNITSWRSRSYSSLGEDQVIAQLVSKKRNGFYVDVGAFHPHKYSNTFYFYKNFNWKGINIEPNPINFKLFEKKRKRDLNLNFGISNDSGELKYFMFKDGLYNTFDSSRKDELISQGMELVSEKLISVKPLSEVFSLYLDNVDIDFLNIDVEMLDLEVLKSIDWNKTRPEVIAVEDHSFKFKSFSDSPIYKLLSQHNYQLESKCHFTCIYKKYDSNV